MNLSANFTLNEFIKSPTAIRMGIDNSPKSEYVKRMQDLCIEVLQPIRDWYGEIIFVRSGYRSPALNSYIGGAAHSQHIKGYAADIDTIDDKDNNIIFDRIMNFHEFDQLIWEFGNKVPAWIHVSFKRNKNRHNILKAYRDEYGVHYSPFIRNIA